MTAPPHDGTFPACDFTTHGLSITTARSSGAGRTPRLIVTGFVDISNVAEFAEAVGEVTCVQTVDVDLTRAEFISGVAISVLFEYRASFESVLVGANTIVALALSASGFPTISDPRAHRSRSRRC